MKRTVLLILIPPLLLLPMTGCGSNDDRLVTMAKDHEGRQHEQNLRMAELQKSVADASKRLVEAEAESREKFQAMQENLRSDQATIGQQRDALEADRREIAAQRNRDPIIAASIVQIGTVLATLLPLLLAGYLVWAMRHNAGEDDAVVAEMLVSELVSEHPRLLAPEPIRLPAPPAAAIGEDVHEGATNE